LLGINKNPVDSDAIANQIYEITPPVTLPESQSHDLKTLYTKIIVVANQLRLLISIKTFIIGSQRGKHSTDTTERPGEIIAESARLVMRLL
jgi:hypothetical protein